MGYTCNVEGKEKKSRKRSRTLEYMEQLKRGITGFFTVV
jgi:hypothetical protein